MCELLSSGKVLYQTQSPWYSLTGNRLTMWNAATFFILKKWNWFRFSVCHIAGGVQVNSYFGHRVMIINQYWQVLLVSSFIASIDILEKIPHFIWLFEIIDEIFELWVFMFFVVYIECIYVLDKKKKKVSWVISIKSCYIKLPNVIT